MSEQLQRDMACEGVLRCFHGLRALDEACFLALVEADEAMTVDELADAVDRERSTAYRAVQRLLQTGFVRKNQVNYDDGGYYHVYTATDPSEIADEMRRLLNDWYAKMGQLIQAFEDKYERTEPAPSAVGG